MAALLAAGLYRMASSLLGAQSPQATADSKTSLAGQQFADSRGGLVLNDASGAPDEYTPTEKLLARLTYAEAAGQHSVPDAMEAVAWTVRNRVESPLFPHTFEEVILQKNQFPSIGGKLWKEAGNPAVLRGPSLRAYNRALAVARGVLTGTIPDPTRGALYFHSGPPTAWFQGAM
jgi:spore germination cell wall hydrolase CwlJ-like protein